MPIDPSAQNRSVIPRWRLSTQFAQLPEVQALSIPGRDGAVPVSELDRLSDEFSQKPSIGRAAELLSACMVESNAEVGRAAAEYVRASGSAGPVLAGVAAAILAGDLNQYGLQQRAKLLVPDVVFNKVRFAKAIGMLRDRVRSGYGSAHSWLDLGYLESIQGDIRSAERAVLAALRLGGNSRVIRRSAARFFVHINEADRAIRTIETKVGYREDPWLLSAHIAIESLCGRRPRYLKKAVKIVETEGVRREDVSELSAAIATEEFQEGAIKKVKVVAKQALVRPTENALAQLAWIDGVGKLHLVSDAAIAGVHNAHEARARVAYANQDWMECCEAVWYWLADQPFSERAALFGSFVSLVLLDDPEQSAFFCEVGLRANPRDFMLLNNLAVAELLSGKLDDAASTLRRSPSPANDQEKVVWLATQGLAKFRGGQHDVGRHFYEQSNELARRVGDLRSVALNRLFLAKEEFRVGNVDEFFAKIGEMAAALKSKNSELASAISKEVAIVRRLPMGEEAARRLSGLIKILKD